MSGEVRFNAIACGAIHRWFESSLTPQFYTGLAKPDNASALGAEDRWFESSNPYHLGAIVAIYTFKCPKCEAVIEKIAKYNDPPPVCYCTKTVKQMKLVPSVPSPMQWGCRKGF